MPVGCTPRPRPMSFGAKSDVAKRCRHVADLTRSGHEADMEPDGHAGLCAGLNSLRGAFSRAERMTARGPLSSNRRSPAGAPGRTVGKGVSQQRPRSAMAGRVSRCSRVAAYAASVMHQLTRRVTRCSRVSFHRAVLVHLLPRREPRVRACRQGEGTRSKQQAGRERRQLFQGHCRLRSLQQLYGKTREPPLWFL